MKKFLKVFLITIIILGAIAGTVFIFFKNYKENIDSSKAVVDFVYDARQDTFKTSLEGVNETLKATESDYRFDLILETYQKLNDSVITLSSYLETYGDKVDDEKIVKKLTDVKNSRGTAESMIAEFNLKSSSTYYNKKLGANDLYEQMTTFLIKYAQLTKEINYQLDDSLIVKNADIKFAFIELYCDVVINDFSNLGAEEGLRIIQNKINIELMNLKFQLTDGSVSGLVNGEYNYLNNYFIKYYSSCNKIQFAKNLAQNVNSVKSISESSTDEQKATFYFNAIYGM